MGGMGFDKLLILGLIVLLLFGAKRIPEVFGSVGKGIKEFKKNINDVQRNIAEPEADARPLERVAQGDQPRVADQDLSRPEPVRGWI